MYRSPSSTLPCPMCEIASSCRCEVALAMASGSCSGNGKTSLWTANINNSKQQQTAVGIFSRFKFSDQIALRSFATARAVQWGCLQLRLWTLGIKPRYFWLGLEHPKQHYAQHSADSLALMAVRHCWLWLPADAVEGHQSAEVREAECRALQGKGWGEDKPKPVASLHNPMQIYQDCFARMWGFSASFIPWSYFIVLFVFVYCISFFVLSNINADITISDQLIVFHWHCI